MPGPSTSATERANARYRWNITHSFDSLYWPLFRCPLHTAMGGASGSQLLSCKGSLVIFPSLLTHLICLGNTLLTYHWLMSLEWTSKLRSCFMAGGQDLLVLPWRSRLSSGGFSVIRQDKTFSRSRPICTQQLSMPPSLICQVTPFSVNPGK